MTDISGQPRIPNVSFVSSRFVSSGVRVHWNKKRFFVTATLISVTSQSYQLVKFFLVLTFNDLTMGDIIFERFTAFPHIRRQLGSRCKHIFSFSGHLDVVSSSMLKRNDVQPACRGQLLRPLHVGLSDVLT